MADTFTAVLNLTKPEIGASADTWGTKLNDNLDDVDGLFQSGPALKVANGGTGATVAADARTNLGLGSMATQNAGAVAITGGTMSGVTVGESGSFTATLATASSGGTAITTGTAYWKKVGDIVSLRLPSLAGSTASTAIYIQGLPAAIQVGAIGGTQYCPALINNGASDAEQGLAVFFASASYARLYSSINQGSFTSATAQKGLAAGVGVVTTQHQLFTYQITD
jgi:hypothetical protein